MTARKRLAPNQDAPQNDSVISTDGIENISDKIIEFEKDTKEGGEKLVTDEMNLKSKHQLKQFKQDVFNKLEMLKKQLGLSQIEYAELKLFIKTEFNNVIDDLSKLSKELKTDVSQLSVKHRDHFMVTLKRSKENTVDAWKRVVPSKSTITEESA